MLADVNVFPLFATIVMGVLSVIFIVRLIDELLCGFDFKLFALTVMVFLLLSLHIFNLSKAYEKYQVASLAIAPSRGIVQSFCEKELDSKDKE